MRRRRTGIRANRRAVSDVRGMGGNAAPTPPGPPRDASEANTHQRFRASLQRSEETRIAVLLALLVILGVLGVLRLATDSGAGDRQRLLAAVLLYLFAGAYAGAMALTIRQARRRGELLPDSLWTLSTTLEGLLPSGLLAVQLRDWSSGAMLPLLTPVLLLYGVVACLSILRLRPWACLVSGLVGAGGYTILISAVAGPAMIREPALLFAYGGNALMIALTGLAAGLVSREILRHVRTALLAAEYRAVLDGVEQELEIARSIQQNLMPSAPPIVPGYDIAFSCRPAERVGGDHCDWRTLAGERYALIVADVSGHGVAAALLMAACSAYGRAVLAGVNEPRAAIATLNRLLVPELADEHFITLAMAVLDPRENVVELVSAGHGPTFHLQADTGRVSRFGGGGPPLGVDVGVDYDPARRIAMARGDALVMLTDGYPERPNAEGHRYGEERLAEFLASHWRGNARGLIANLDQEMEAFAGRTPAPDDMTILVIARTAAQA